MYVTFLLNYFSLNLFVRSDPFIVEECYEFLLLVAAASENGLVKFYESGVMDMLAPHISTLTDGIKCT